MPYPCCGSAANVLRSAGRGCRAAVPAHCLFPSFIDGKMPEKTRRCQKTSQLVGRDLPSKVATELMMGLFAAVPADRAVYAACPGVLQPRRGASRCGANAPSFGRSSEANRGRIREGYRLRSEMRQEIRRTRESFRWATRDQARSAIREAAGKCASRSDAHRYWRD